MMGFLLTDLQCANKHVYALRGQAIGIVKVLGTVLVSLSFPLLEKRELCPSWLERLQLALCGAEEDPASP